MKNLGWKALAFSVALTFAGCGGAADSAPLTSGEHPPVELSAWAAYWDSSNGIREYELAKEELSSIACFCTYYNTDGEFVFPEELPTLVEKVKGDEKICYMTFVNDEKKENGKIVEKSTELLHVLLKDEEIMSAKAEEMADFAQNAGCDGVDLDYEAFWKKDKDLIPNFVAFVKLLNDACQQRDLKLRIVLEPSADMEAGFPEGPEYVVMFYNLFGKHSGPGPKADEAFIQKTIKKMEALPGKKNAAFATGGCLWESDGFFDPKIVEKRFLSQEEAEKLCKENKAKTERDSKSAVLRYTFGDLSHKTEVWYADSETINAWITLAANAGITNVSIWRLGNNTDIDKVRAK